MKNKLWSVVLLQLGSSGNYGDRVTRWKSSTTCREEIPLLEDSLYQTVWMGLNLLDDTKKELINVLRANSRMFAWSHEDMPRIDSKVITHKLNIRPDVKPSHGSKKEYLGNPPLLSSHVFGETLYLYLAISKAGVSVVLIWEDYGVQRPVYYVSRALQGVEVRYPSVNKLALSMVIEAVFPSTYTLW